MDAVMTPKSSPISDIAIVTLAADDATQRLDELADLLVACVKEGASISFIEPFDHAASLAFWQTKVLPGVGNGTRVLLVALSGGRIVGSVQLDCDTPPNQPHRAEVSKLLVHPDARRKGIARRLMIALEGQARKHDRSLITLDTRTGDAAEPLYQSLGYITVGQIPDFARDVATDRLDATTVMYKKLG
jgi:ribosomal protein S18 acetylase RimI-like enzyme